MPVFRPGPSKTALSHLPVVSRGDGDTNKHTLIAPKVYALAGLSAGGRKTALASLLAGAFENGVVSSPRRLPLLWELPREDGIAQTQALIVLTFTHLSLYRPGGGFREVV